MPLLWQIDDIPDCHAVVQNTLARLPSDLWQSEHFSSANGALLAWEQACSAPAGLPDVILMDFYIGHDRGDALTKSLRSSEPKEHHSIIVGHSSVSHCSRIIVGCGGDIDIRKYSNEQGYNPALLEWLLDFA